MKRRQLIALAVLLCCFALPALAQTESYDLLQTGSGASVDLSSQGLGTVNLQGVPIMSSLGSTDTIIQRNGNSGSVSINVYALFMKSTSPVTFSGQSCDVYVTINNSGANGGPSISTSVLPQPDSLSGSTGTMTINSGGTFDSSFTVNADVIFVKAGTSVTSSGNWVGHGAAPSNSMSSTGSSWSSTAPAGYPSNSSYPSGGVYPKPIHTGPHPVVPSSCGTSAPATQPTSPNSKSANLALQRACTSVTTLQ